MCGPFVCRPGLTDGAMTEVEGEDLTEGMKVVTGLRPRPRARTGTSNPFAPQFMRRAEAAIQDSGGCHRSGGETGIMELIELREHL